MGEGTRRKDRQDDKREGKWRCESEETESIAELYVCVCRYFVVHVSDRKLCVHWEVVCSM